MTAPAHLPKDPTACYTVTIVRESRYSLSHTAFLCTTPCFAALAVLFCVQAAQDKDRMLQVIHLGSAALSGYIAGRLGTWQWTGYCNPSNYDMFKFIDSRC